MLKKTSLILGLVLLAACSEAPGNLEVETFKDGGSAAFTPLGPTAQEEDMFAGNWTARNPDTGEIMVIWELRVEDQTWMGQYRLTEAFCQTRDETKASACPFAGQGGSWEQIQAGGGVLSARAPDPFQTDALFTLQMLAPNGTDVTKVALSADLGAVQLNANIEPAAE